MIRYRICIKHNETIGVRHQRLLAFGPSLASLTSDLTLVSPSFGWPDLASELPLVPRVASQSNHHHRYHHQSSSMFIPPSLYSPSTPSLILRPLPPHKTPLFPHKTPFPSQDPPSPSQDPLPLPARFLFEQVQQLPDY